MAKSNWRGTSGWGAIPDPTNVLEGRVLVASAGTSSVNVDYLQYYVNTSTAWNKDHYSVKIDYAWPTSTSLFTAGSLGLIARANDFTSTTYGTSTAKSCYIGVMDNATRSFSIIKRVADVNTTIASCSMNDTATSIGTKHTMEFKCYGVSQVALQLWVDNQIVINTGDTTSTKISSGEPGIYASSGTTYIDNFTTYEYTTTGATPTLWEPDAITALKAWYRADTVVTVGSNVSTWTDKSGNSNDATQGTTSDQPQLETNAVNAEPALDFDGTSDYLYAAHASTLNMFATGFTVYWVAKADSWGTVSGTIYRGPIIQKGSAPTYGVQYRTDTSGSTSPTEGIYFNPVTGATASSDKAVSTGNWQVVGFVSNKTNASPSTNYGFFRNGAQYGTVAVGPTTDNSDQLEVGRGSTYYFDGKMAELIIIAEEVSEADRQKIEGYLAWRYGLESDLPLSHPYKNSAPTA